LTFSEFGLGSASCVSIDIKLRSLVYEFTGNVIDIDTQEQFSLSMCAYSETKCSAVAMIANRICKEQYDRL